MAILTKEWNDGSGDVLTVSTSSGSGNDSLSLSSSVNEGIDRSMSVSVANSAGSPSLSAVISVSQTGLREPFNGSDTSFLLSDNGTFNVLKQ